MKPKRMKMKLVLNKNTVADLNSQKMDEIIAGETGPGTTCLTWQSDFVIPSGCYTVYPNYCICGKDNISDMAC
jgi:hypothetical protein